MKQGCILLATDLSANAALAARWARNCAVLTGRQVILAHIIELSVPNWLRDAYDALDDEEKKAELEGKVHEWYKTHTHTDADGVLLAGGEPVQALNELVEESGASLLVLARSGKNALTRLLVGSTAQMMAVNPPCSVAVVHPDHTDIDESTKLAVATDLTITAEEALADAAKLAALVGAQLDIVHATTLFAPTVNTRDLPEQFSPSELTAKANQQMEKVLGEHADELTNVTYKSHVIEASPVEGLTTFAEDNHSDMVFVGNAAQYSLLTNVFGRVSVKLLQTLPSTIVIVPPPKDESSEEE